MELNLFQQIFDQLTKANKVLIALPSTLTTDNTASALGLLLFLRKLNKDVDVVSSGVLPQNLKFLPQVDLIKPGLQSSKAMVISVDISKKPVDEISYEPKGDKLNIFLKSKTQEFVPEDVSFFSEKTPYQVAIILDSQGLEGLGKLFEDNADVFFHTPKINIDNKASNEYYGAINFIDINATSISEMLADLFGTFEQQLIDEDIATCLLAGIITKTNSFQYVQTTPKAFLKASELISLGGRQQEVIKHLFKTKPLPLLRLWGRALARLKTLDGTIYSLLSLSDFEKSESGENELPQVLKEFLENTSGYKIIALLSEQSGGGVKILLATHPQISLQDLGTKFGQNGKALEWSLGTYKFYEFVFDQLTLAGAEEKFMEAVKGL